MDDVYISLQVAYGEAASLSSTHEQLNHWLDRSQRLRHLRLSLGEDELDLVVTATAAMSAERRRVAINIDNLVADRF